MQIRPRTVFRIMIFLAGTLLISGGIISILKGVQTQNWPSVQGLVISTDVVKISRSGSSPSFKPIVQYSYNVDEEIYRNSRLGVLSQTYGKADKAEQYILPYQSGNPVLVYYNPETPEDSLLEVGINWGSYLMAAVGLIFILISIFFGRSKKH